MEFHTTDELFAALQIPEIRRVLLQTASDASQRSDALKQLLQDRYGDIIGIADEASSMLDGVKELVAKVDQLRSASKKLFDLPVLINDATSKSTSGAHAGSSTSPASRGAVAASISQWLSDSYEHISVFLDRRQYLDAAIACTVALQLLAVAASHGKPHHTARVVAQLRTRIATEAGRHLAGLIRGDVATTAGTPTDENTLESGQQQSALSSHVEQTCKCLLALVVLRAQSHSASFQPESTSAALTSQVAGSFADAAAAELPQVIQRALQQPTRTWIETCLQSASTSSSTNGGRNHSNSGVSTALSPASHLVASGSVFDRLLSAARSFALASTVCSALLSYESSFRLNAVSVISQVSVLLAHVQSDASRLPANTALAKWRTEGQQLAWLAVVTPPPRWRLIAAVQDGVAPADPSSVLSSLTGTSPSSATATASAASSLTAAAESSAAASSAWSASVTARVHSLVKSLVSTQLGMHQHQQPLDATPLGSDALAKSGSSATAAAVAPSSSSFSSSDALAAVTALQRSLASACGALEVDMMPSHNSNNNSSNNAQQQEGSHHPSLRLNLHATLFLKPLQTLATACVRGALSDRLQSVARTINATAAAVADAAAAGSLGAYARDDYGNGGDHQGHDGGRSGGDTERPHHGHQAAAGARATAASSSSNSGDTDADRKARVKGSKDAIRKAGERFKTFAAHRRRDESMSRHVDESRAAAAASQHAGSAQPARTVLDLLLHSSLPEVWSTTATSAAAVAVLVAAGVLEVDSSSILRPTPEAQSTLPSAHLNILLSQLPASTASMLDQRVWRDAARAGGWTHPLGLAMGVAATHAGASAVAAIVEYCRQATTQEESESEAAGAVASGSSSSKRSQPAAGVVEQVATSPLDDHGAAAVRAFLAQVLSLCSERVNSCAGAGGAAAAASSDGTMPAHASLLLRPTYASLFLGQAAAAIECLLPKACAELDIPQSATSGSTSGVTTASSALASASASCLSAWSKVVGMHAAECCEWQWKRDGVIVANNSTGSATAGDRLASPATSSGIVSSPSLPPCAYAATADASTAASASKAWRLRHGNWVSKNIDVASDAADANASGGAESAQIHLPVTCSNGLAHAFDRLSFHVRMAGLLDAPVCLTPSALLAAVPGQTGLQLACELGLRPPYDYAQDPMVVSVPADSNSGIVSKGNAPQRYMMMLDHWGHPHPMLYEEEEGGLNNGDDDGRFDGQAFSASASPLLSAPSSSSPPASHASVRLGLALRSSRLAAQTMASAAFRSQLTQCYGAVVSALCPTSSPSSAQASTAAQHKPSDNEGWSTGHDDDDLDLDLAAADNSTIAAGAAAGVVVDAPALQALLDLFVAGHCLPESVVSKHRQTASKESDGLQSLLPSAPTSIWLSMMRPSAVEARQQQPPSPASLWSRLSSILDPIDWLLVEAPLRQYAGDCIRSHALSWAAAVPALGHGALSSSASSTAAAASGHTLPGGLQLQVVYPPSSGSGGNAVSWRLADVLLAAAGGAGSAGGRAGVPGPGNSTSQPSLPAYASSSPVLHYGLSTVGSHYAALLSLHLPAPVSTADLEPTAVPILPSLPPFQRLPLLPAPVNTRPGPLPQPSPSAITQLMTNGGYRRPEAGDSASAAGSGGVEDGGSGGLARGLMLEFGGPDSIQAVHDGSSDDGGAGGGGGLLSPTLSALLSPKAGLHLLSQNGTRNGAAAGSGAAELSDADLAASSANVHATPAKSAGRGASSTPGGAAGGGGARSAAASILHSSIAAATAAAASSPATAALLGLSSRIGDRIGGMGGLSGGFLSSGLAAITGSAATTAAVPVSSPQPQPAAATATGSGTSRLSSYLDLILPGT